MSAGPASSAPTYNAGPTTVSTNSFVQSICTLAAIAITFATLIDAGLTIPAMAENKYELIDTKLQIEPVLAKAGDVVRMTVSVHNQTNHKVSLDVILPLIVDPEIRDAKTLRRVPFRAAAINDPIMPKTIVLNPDQNLTLLTYRLKLSNGPVEDQEETKLISLSKQHKGADKFSLIGNSGIMNGTPGTYTVSFTLVCKSVLVYTGTKEFQIIK